MSKIWLFLIPAAAIGFALRRFAKAPLSVVIAVPAVLFWLVVAWFQKSFGQRWSKALLWPMQSVKDLFGSKDKTPVIGPNFGGPATAEELRYTDYLTGGGTADFETWRKWL